MKKSFETPEVDVLRIEVEDILTTSDTDLVMPPVELN